MGTLGRFVLEHRLGTGGMGEVWAAVDPNLGRRVALKLVRAERDTPDARAMLQREAQTMARVSHPNIAQVYEVDRVGDQLYVAMEYLGRGTLRADQRGRPWREIVARYLVAARGLVAAHRAGIVHRDFKPDNVLLGEAGRIDDQIKVADFGMAGVGASEAATDVVGGTPAYMAPEQLLGKAVDARSDQFSFCVALFEALAGERPFAAPHVDGIETALVAITAITDGRIGDTRRLPRALVPILRRGLAADPAERFPDMAALADAIARATAGRTRTRGALVGGAAAAVAVATIAIVHLASGGGAPVAQASVTAPAAPTTTALADLAQRTVAPRLSRDGAWFAIAGREPHYIAVLDDRGVSLAERALPDDFVLEAVEPDPARRTLVVAGSRAGRFEIWRLAVGGPGATLLGALPADERAMPVAGSSVGLALAGDGALALGRTALYRFVAGRAPERVVALDAHAYEGLRIAPGGTRAFAVAMLEGIRRLILVDLPARTTTPVAMVPGCNDVFAADWLDDRRAITLDSCNAILRLHVIDAASGRVERELESYPHAATDLWVTRRGVEIVNLHQVIELDLGRLGGPLHTLGGPLVTNATAMGWRDADHLVLRVPVRERDAVNAHDELVELDVDAGRTTGTGFRLPPTSIPAFYDGRRAVVIDDACEIQALVDGQVVARARTDCASHVEIACADPGLAPCVAVRDEAGTRAVRAFDPATLAIGATAIAHVPLPTSRDPTGAAIDRAGKHLCTPRGGDRADIVDLATGAITPVVVPGAHLQFAGWEADGQHAILSVLPTTDAPSRLLRVALDGTLAIAAESDTAFGYPRFSPDGRLAVSELRLMHSVDLVDFHL